MIPEETFPPSRFIVRRWIDPVVEGRGFPVNSVYTETVILPILGPSTTFCLRRLGAWAAVEPAGMTVDTRQLARDLGLGDGLGRNSPIARTLERLCQFGMAQWHEAELSVRTVVAPVTERQLARLSPRVVHVHRSMVRRAQGEDRSFASPLNVSADPVRSNGPARRP
jgi:hypothetical protein